MNSRDEPDKTVKVSLPDSAMAAVYVREAMSVEEFLASACARKNLNPTEHFIRVKKRREMEDHNYFVPHRSDLIETYVSETFTAFYTCIVCDTLSICVMGMPPTIHVKNYLFPRQTKTFPGLSNAGNTSVNLCSCIFLFYVRL